MSKYTLIGFLLATSCFLFSCNYIQKSLHLDNKDHVIKLRTEPIDTVRIAFIGLGQRGTQAVGRYTQIEGVKIKVLCDVVPEQVEKNQTILKEHGLPEADEYSQEDDWKKICERPDIDLIYICTPWKLHTPIATYAMEQGKHVATEVPAALTVNEAWHLVKTAEKTRRHCIQLENCIYDFYESSVHHMVQKGMFGEIKHAEGAYIHDLTWKLFDSTTGYWNMWRLKQHMKKDGNAYPTHGIGPIAHILNIHRGDRMEFISSHSSNQYQLTEYAKDHFPDSSKFVKADYAKGDINTSIIKTEKGKTILLQHDEVSPRPYTRLFKISGTKGFAQKYPSEGLAFAPNSHHYMSHEKKDSILKANRHPIVRDIEEKAKQVGGHGGMDFIMDYRLIYCLRNGLPLDQDVYDAAEWSALIELSRESAKQNGKRLEIPDFTRGAYKNANELKYYLK